MATECGAALFEFARVEGRSVVGAFDGGKITSDAGGLLLAATDLVGELLTRFACALPHGFVTDTTRANSNSVALHSVGIGTPPDPEINR